VTVEPIENGCLRVWLTDTELREWGLDAPQPSAGRIRRLIRQISAAAEWSDTRRVTAELIPVEDGGVLLVSPWVRSPADTPSVYYLQDGDTLLDLLRQWRYITDDDPPTCLLYRAEKGYVLVVYPALSLSYRRQCLLTEYGTLIGEGEGVAAHCGEYGQLIRAGWLTEPAPPLPEPQDPPH